MKAVYLGTPEFAVPTLERMVSAGHEVVAVFTQPDRPKGRGQELAPPPVKEAALRLGIAVHQPERIRRPEQVELLRTIAPEVMVVVGYGQIIPQSIIDIPKHGIINVHASLLPKYRGAAPIQWAIANGETETGVTTMRIDAGLDTGDMLLEWRTAIGPEETAPELSARLATAGADLLAETLRGLEQGTITPRPQDHAAATLAPILKKEDGRIDWNWRAPKIHARSRGFQPWPGAYAEFRGQTLQVARCHVAAERTEAAPGSILPSKRKLLVACGEGSVVELAEVQPQGRKRMPGEAFRNGQRLLDNERIT
ncbi:MAG: methionyl-tRNA formyltransferase [Bryobacteraceae bacterium]